MKLRETDVNIRLTSVRAVFYRRIRQLLAAAVLVVKSFYKHTHNEC